MKLQNKKTGEIAEVKSVSFYCEGENGQRYEWSLRKYSDGITLAELNEVWEDYEEPDDWFIDFNGKVVRQPGTHEERKEIGNYFGTKEEAEKAVEKLKAFKRLKDCGFKFVGWERDKQYSGDYHIEAEDYDKCDDKDLDLIFGGEE